MTEPSDPSRSASARCAVHPARPAVGACPVCGRPRCGVDEARFAGRGCAACLTGERAPSPPGVLERRIRAALGGLAAALVGGVISTQYVDVHVFSLVAPALVGLAVAWAAATARGRGPADPVIPVLSAVLAILGAALGFRLVTGGQDPWGPWGEVGPPYLCAVFGTLLWPLVFAPPPRRRPTQQQPDQEPEGRATR